MKKITMLALFACALEFASSDAMIVHEKEIKIPETNGSSVVCEQSQNKPMSVAFELPSLSPRLLLPWRSDDPRGNMIVLTSTIEEQNRMFSEWCMGLYQQAMEQLQYEDKYGVHNGLLGMNRDIFLRLAAIMKNDKNKIRVLLGIGNECFLWKNHPYFEEIRQHVFPKPWDVKEINEKLVNHFATLDGGYHYGTDGTDGVGQDWFREFLRLFRPTYCAPKWKYKFESQDKMWNIKRMTFDECLDVCSSPGFKVLDQDEQAFYKRELYIRLVHGGFSRNLDRLPELPYDIFLLVLANCKYYGLFSKSQFQWIPVQCIKKGDPLAIKRLCRNKDKLPKKHLVAIDKRIDELVEQCTIAYDIAQHDYEVAGARARSRSNRCSDMRRMVRYEDGLPTELRVALDKCIDEAIRKWVISSDAAEHGSDSGVFSTMCRLDIPSRLLDDVRKLREEFPKSCF